VPRAGAGGGGVTTRAGATAAGASTTFGTAGGSAFLITFGVVGGAALLITRGVVGGVVLLITRGPSPWSAGGRSVPAGAEASSPRPARSPGSPNCPGPVKAAGSTKAAGRPPSAKGALHSSPLNAAGCWLPPPGRRSGSPGTPCPRVPSQPLVPPAAGSWNAAGTSRRSVSAERDRPVSPGRLVSRRGGRYTSSGSSSTSGCSPVGCSGTRARPAATSGGAAPKPPSAGHCCCTPSAGHCCRASSAGHCC
jgi:hypothetical protein